MHPARHEEGKGAEDGPRNQRGQSEQTRLWSAERVTDQAALCEIARGDRAAERLYESMAVMNPCRLRSPSINWRTLDESS